MDSPGVKIDPTRDLLEVDGKKVAFHGKKRLFYLMLNKPVQVVTTAKDPQGRRTVFDVLPQWAARRRLFPVGRLDYFSEGLLLLTTDGELAHRLTHPSRHAPKTYHVRVRGRVENRRLEAMRKGMRLAEGEHLAPVKAKILHAVPDKNEYVLEMELIQGINRQIRRMCRDLDLTVLRLRRVSLGPVALGDLPTGKFRDLTPEEVRALRRSVDMDASGGQGTF